MNHEVQILLYIHWIIVYIYLFQFWQKHVPKHILLPKSQRSDSCETSPIRQNVTLRGGIRAGYFQKLTQYVAMQLCIQLCCQKKGCDVAFMVDKNCYGVKCFSEYLCHIVPAKNAPRSLILSKVNFKGEENLERFMPERLRCFQIAVEHNVTLKDGLLAGNFTAVGHVKDIDTCAKLCCVRDNCNMALMIKNHCFMVRCKNNAGCKSIPVVNKQLHTHIVRVKRTKVVANEQQIVRALSISSGKRSMLFCKNAAIQYNRTLLGGYEAGEFKLLSTSIDMSACIRLCCSDVTCDVAFMIEVKCYGVLCKTEKLCKAIPARTSSLLQYLSPKLSYITNRNEQVSTIVIKTEREICKSNVISYDVTLRGGTHVKQHKVFSEVNNIEDCIRVCCQEKYCDVALMINGTCFIVRCRNEQSCEEVKSSTSYKMKPMLSFVVRENNIDVQRSKLFQPKNNHHQKGYRNNDISINKALWHLEMTSLIKHTEKEFYVKQSGITSLLNEFRCTKSKIMHNVTLRGGIASGIFKDKGILSNMQKCVQICCNAKKCHVAFMISGHCFSVTCKNQSLCEVVSARRTKYNSYIAYIYTRSKVDYKLKYNETTTKGKYKRKKSKNLQEDKKQFECSKRISKNKHYWREGSYLA